MTKKDEEGAGAASEFNAFIEDFRAESDRAAVILAAAKLDLILSQILRQYLLPCTSASDELLEGDSPLATFSSRIKLCYRLGLIDKQITNSLNLVRRIRNSFAHELSGVSLKSGAHRDRIRELVAPIIQNLHFRNIILSKFGKVGEPGAEFRAFCCLLALRLEGRREHVATVPDGRAMTLTPPAYTKPYRAESKDTPSISSLGDGPDMAPTQP